eukprot:scaffold18755_cov107-Isochrysis_galbana.AAC.1
MHGDAARGDTRANDDPACSPATEWSSRTQAAGRAHAPPPQRPELGPDGMAKRAAPKEYNTHSLTFSHLPRIQTKADREPIPAPYMMLALVGRAVAVAGSARPCTCTLHFALCTTPEV